MSDVPELNVEEVEARMGEAVLVDVRDAGSFRRSHIPGALSVLDHNVAEFVATADKDKTVVVYCYHGNSSLGGAAYFLENGFREVYSMSGGFAAWRGPTEQPEPPPERVPLPRKTRDAAPPPEPAPRSRRGRWLKRLRSLAGKR